MEEALKPPRKRSLVLNLIVGFIALVGGLVLLVLGSGDASRQPNLLQLALALVLFVVEALFSYQVFLVLTTRFQLTRSALELQWGFRREVLPLEQVEWAHPVLDFDSPMPLPGFVLPFQYYGIRRIRGLGTVEFAATDRRNMVLIRADNRHFVISPEDAYAFASEFEKLSALGPQEVVAPLSQTGRNLIGEILQDGMARKLFTAGIVGLLTLTAVSIALSATRPTITWITLELVPSNRLLLLLLVGGLDWLLNTFLGGYFYLRGLLEKRWIFLIWSWSAFMSLTLSAAAVFMTLGSA